MLIFLWFLITCSEMRGFSQMRFLHDSFEQLKGKKRTWANPKSSNQWKSPYESDNSSFRFSLAFFRFEQVRKMMMGEVPLASLYYLKL